MNTIPTPEGLSPLQYAQKICEDCLLPSRGNIQMIGESIEAISKSRLFRGRADSTRCAFIWLSRRVEVAQSQGQKINNLWFMNGLYNDVEKPKGEAVQLKWCGKNGCIEGWIPEFGIEMKIGGRVKRCSCWRRS